jgi:tetratricopeptide (TPR) repeat protein
MSSRQRIPRTGDPAQDRRAARDDEPTRVAPLHYSGVQLTAKRDECAADHAPPVPDRQTHAAPFSLPPSSREPRIGRYHVQVPEHGATDVLSSHPPPRRSGVQRSNPDSSADTYYAAAEVLMRRGDYRAAVLAAQRAMKVQRPQPHQQALYAWLLYQRDGGAGAARVHVWDHVDRALASDSTCAIAHCIRGLLLQRANRRSEARVHLERAQQLAAEQRSDHAAALLALDEDRRPQEA